MFGLINTISMGRLRSGLRYLVLAFLLLAYPVESRALSRPPPPQLEQVQPPGEQKAPPDSEPGGAKERAKAFPRSPARGRGLLDWIVFAFWLSLAFGGGFGAGYIYARLYAHRRSPKEPRSPARTADELSPPAPPPPAGREQTPAGTPGAADAFRRYHSELNDLYGELWRAAEKPALDENNRAQVLSMWRKRLDQLDSAGAKPLIDAWNAMQRVAEPKSARQKAAIWLDTLQVWGPEKEQPAEIDINEETLRRFYIHPKQTTGRAIVVAPCWLYRGLVEQKGEAIPVPSS
jgi:hypothetical protein